MHYKSLFVSDIHLGTPQCRVEFLLQFMHDNTFDNIFLIGDIVDIWAHKHWKWNINHNTFIQKILRESRKGTNVVYIPGNHDEAIREVFKDNPIAFFGDIKIVNEYSYDSVCGLKLLLMHGDEFDGAIRNFGWLYSIGDRAYALALWLNTLFNKCRKLCGLRYWSLSAYLKSKVKEAVQVVNNFEELVTRKCIMNGFDGVVFGHIHTASIKVIKTKLIMNDGDMCESMTCIVETTEGIFQLRKLTDDTILASYNKG